MDFVIKVLNQKIIVQPILQIIITLLQVINNSNEINLKKEIKIKKK